MLFKSFDSQKDKNESINWIKKKIFYWLVNIAGPWPSFFLRRVM